MNQEEMKKEFRALYEKMANSNDVTLMHIFGKDKANVCFCISP